MKKVKERLDVISIERPVGCESNTRVLDFIQKEMKQMGYEIITLPFECNRWEKGKSFIEQQGKLFEIFPCPFSKSYKGKGEILVIDSLDKLKSEHLTDKILLFNGNMAKKPFQPKDFPFYYPDEDKKVIDVLEKSNPLAIIGATGKQSMCGLNPFPIFEDGNFHIPSAYVNEINVKEIVNGNGNIYLNIDSSVIPSKSIQIMGKRKENIEKKRKIVICAHMDSKYGTPGAIDNASGVTVMLELMESLKNYNGNFDLEFVPFNSEEYYAVKGQLKYLEYMKNEDISVKLVINLDSLGHRKSRTALSSYNFNDEIKRKLNTKVMKNKYMIIGEQWYAGDHSMFTAQGIPCIAVTSSNLYEDVLQLTHTKNDTIDNIDYNLIKITADFLTEFINSLEN